MRQEIDGIAINSSYPCYYKDTKCRNAARRVNLVDEIVGSVDKKIERHTPQRASSLLSGDPASNIEPNEQEADPDFK